MLVSPEEWSATFPVGVRGHSCTQCSVAFTNPSPSCRAADYAFSQRAEAGRHHRRIRAHVMNVNELVRGLNVPCRDVGTPLQSWRNMVALGTDRSRRITRGHIKNYVGTSCIDDQLNASTMKHTGPSSGDRARWIATAANDGILVRGGAALPLSTALLMTACLAAVVEHRSKIGAVIGAPLLCFGVFCILSNLHLVPATHALYDLCWSFLLPLSLSIIILGNPAVAQRALSGPPSVKPTRTSRGTIGPLGRVGLAFGIGAAGSLAGVGVAFRFATANLGGVFILPRETAAKIAGAVAATYIGGSVNLFAVAAAVGMMDATTTGGASLLGALAVSDIFLMALYFSGLVAAHKTPLLRRVFPAADCSVTQAQAATERNGNPMVKGGVNGAMVSRRASFTAVAKISCMLLLGSVVCAAGRVLAEQSPLPGTATMAVTLLTVGISRVFCRLAPQLHASMFRKAPALSAILLNVFFASVGASGRWAQVVGVAPAIFAFAAVALVVHIAIVVTGTALLNRLCRVGIGIDEMIVASNANIGGPSTAATFAGLIRQDSLVVPAAIWGTVGYAVATTLGVAIWAFLK